MTMEKQGVVDERTPQEGVQGPSGCCGGGCHGEQQTKQAADAQEDHLATRLSDAAAQAASKK